MGIRMKSSLPDPLSYDTLGMTLFETVGGESSPYSLMRRAGSNSREQRDGVGA